MMASSWIGTETSGWWPGFQNESTVMSASGNLSMFLWRNSSTRDWDTRPTTLPSCDSREVGTLIGESSGAADETW